MVTVYLTDAGLFEIFLEEDVTFYFAITAEGDNARYTIYTSIDNDGVLVADSLYQNFDKNSTETLKGLKRFVLDIINVGSMGKIILKYEELPKRYGASSQRRKWRAFCNNGERLQINCK
jgi:hypothetical protein